MTLTIEITPELEHQINQAAEKAGLSPDTYVLQLLHQNFQSPPPQASSGVQLPKGEAELIQIINRSLSDADWQRYNALIEKREAEALTSDEQEELIAWSDQLENDNIKRIQAVAALAQLRHTSIDALMRELDLQPLVHA
ncbi:MAG: hypothetical protein AAF572_07290 [Cyanobacteria bacterium P01_B01_bin.77]